MKILPNNIAIIESDTHISKWVQEHGTLAIAEPMLRAFRHLIPIGGTVLDIGANIGDHTATLSDYVGRNGMVHCFEPNPEAYECLVHNIVALNLRASANPIALSDREGEGSLHKLVNAGASYLEEGSGFPLATLDSFALGPDFIKIDVEGYETFVLMGGAKTIRKHKPAMLIEVNRMALERAGSSRDALFSLLRSFGYSIVREDPRLAWEEEQYDIICTQ